MYSLKKIGSLILALIVLSTSVAFATDVSSITAQDPETKSDIQKGLNQPYGLAVDHYGVVYIADSYNNMIKKVTQDGLVIVAGGYDGKNSMGFPRGGLVDGVIASARFNRPRAITLSKEGVVFVADTGNNVIRKIEKDTVSTIAGTGVAGNRDGAANVAQFNLPSSIKLGTDGKLYVADTLNHSIRVIELNGTTTTLSLKADGTTLKAATLNEPSDLCFGKDGTLYILDSGSQSIKKVKDGILSLVAGDFSDFNMATGYVNGALVNGKADKARFNFPKGLAIDEKGNLFVSDSWNHSIRVITPEGVVRTLSGSSFLGNKVGALSEARFNLPTGIAVKGNQLLVSDMWNNEVKTLEINYNSSAFGYTVDQLKGLITQTGTASTWTLWENQKTVSLEKPILTQDAKVYLPFKATMTHYGYTLSWDAVNRHVLFTKDGKTQHLDEQRGMIIFNDNSYLETDALSQLLQKYFYVLEEEKAIIGIDY